MQSTLGDDDTLFIVAENVYIVVYEQYEVNLEKNVYWLWCDGQANHSLINICVVIIYKNKEDERLMRLFILLGLNINIYMKKILIANYSINLFYKILLGFWFWWFIMSYIYRPKVCLWNKLRYIVEN